MPSVGIEPLCVKICSPRCQLFLAVAWHRPPSDTVDSFNKLEKALDYLDKKGKEIILLCDTYCDLAKSPADQPLDHNVKHTYSIYDLFNLKQYIKEPTRVTLTTATTSARKILKSGVHEVFLNDLFMVH